MPIQSLTVRELVYDAQGNVVHEPRPPQGAASSSVRRSRPPPAAAPAGTQAGPEARRGRRRVPDQGRQGRRSSTVKLGIAGERYLEVLSGLKEGDRVITGPFDSVRSLYEGDLVKTAPKPARDYEPNTRGTVA